MDFKALQEANDSIELTDIKGKKYAQVNQRIKAFRMCYPEGAIVTELKNDTNGRCVFGATIYAEYPGKILGTGTATPSRGMAREKGENNHPPALPVDDYFHVL